jgi:hypothetical protein
MMPRSPVWCSQVADLEALGAQHWPLDNRFLAHAIGRTELLSRSLVVPGFEFARRAEEKRLRSRAFTDSRLDRWPGSRRAWGNKRATGLRSACRHPDLNFL